MTIKELAEREYPFANMHTQMNLIKSRERAAFIKGLEHAIEFVKWSEGPQMKGIEKAFEIFLDEKYGSNENNKH